MIFIVGECTGRRVERIQRNGWGRMWIARGRNIYTYPGEPWGFDNGVYRDYTAGNQFDEDLYMSCVKKVLEHDSSPYLAVLPDVVGHAEASLEMSRKWRNKLGDCLPWYLALQDGMTAKDVSSFVGDVVGLFLGGTNSFKAEAGYWCDYAHEHNLRFHYGRCGTANKLAHALRVGADSADSAGMMWEEQRWGLTEEILSNGPVQKDIFDPEGE